MRELCNHHAKDPAPHGLWGGLQISLDLEKIFDVVNRNHVLRSLEFFEIDNNLQLVHAWMMPHEHCIPLWFLLGDFRPCLLVENYSMETRGDEHTPRL